MKTFKEFLTESSKIVLVQKADCQVATKKDVIKNDQGEYKIKKKEGYFLVKNPQNPQSKIYIKKKPDTTVKNNINSGGFLGFYYVIDKQAALARSKMSAHTQKKHSHRRTMKAARTMRKNNQDQYKHK